MKPFRSFVRTVPQTTYTIHDRPDAVKIIYQPHPLFQQTLEIVGQRRESDETYWIVKLADSSHLKIPSYWTDQPVGRVPAQSDRLGARATSQALRELLTLLEHLVTQSSIVDACPHTENAGETDAKANATVRERGTKLGRAPTAEHGRRDPQSGDHSVGRDGLCHDIDPLQNGAGGQVR